MEAPAGVQEEAAAPSGGRAFVGAFVNRVAALAGIGCPPTTVRLLEEQRRLEKLRGRVRLAIIARLQRRVPEDLNVSNLYASALISVYSDRTVRFADDRMHFHLDGQLASPRLPTRPSHYYIVATVVPILEELARLPLAALLVKPAAPKNVRQKRKATDE